MLLEKNSNTVYTIVTIIFIVIFAIYFSNSINKPYGNDKESIEEVISSIEGYETELIEILEIKDIKEKRIVSFLYNTDPAYIEFSRNQKGNYEWRHIQKSEGQSFASYLIHTTDYGSTISYFMIITNEKNSVAKMELSVNGKVIEHEFSVNKRAVTWIELPETKDNSYSFKYKYYDKDGNLIGDY